MPAAIPFILISVLLAVIAVAQGRRHSHRHIAKLAAAGRASVKTAPAHKRTALVRVGRVGSTVLANPVRSRVIIAPEGSARTAFEVTGSGLTANVPVAGVIMARVWSRGLLVLEFGSMGREYGSAWPVSPEIAGWEIHVVDASGQILRCYGGPEGLIDDDVARLSSRVLGATAPAASTRVEARPADRAESPLAAAAARLLAQAS
jgi:hypothetical protein